MQNNFATTEFKRSLNIYAYVNGNPVSNTDPLGLCPWCVAGAVIGGGANVGFQLYNNGGNWGALNYQIGLAAAGGALGGGLGTITSGLGVGWNIVANALGSTAISATQPEFVNVVGKIFSYAAIRSSSIWIRISRSGLSCT